MRVGIHSWGFWLKTMTCLVCGSLKTIKAHLIPKAFVNDLKVLKSENTLLIHEKVEKFKRTRTGVYDDSILCGNCDQKLGNYENAALKMLRRVTARITKTDYSLATFPVATIRDVSGSELIRFAAGIVWKYSVSDSYKGGLTLGPYQTDLQNVAFENAEIPNKIDLLCFALHGPLARSRFYKEPFMDKQHDVNIVRFSVRGCVFFLKLDKRLPTDSHTRQFWLRGKTEADVIIASEDRFDEVETLKELIHQNNVQGYLREGKYK